MKRILALVDFGDRTDAVTRAAGQLAAALGGSVVLLHVSTPDADYEGDALRENVSRDGIAAELHRGRRRLRTMAQDISRLGAKARPLLVRSFSARGDPRAKIRQEIARLRPDLIITGANRHGVWHRIFGPRTVSEGVLKSLPCAVMVVPVGGDVQVSETGPGAFPRSDVAPASLGRSSM